MACKYTYKGVTYNSKEEFVNQVINPQFLGKSNNTLPFIKSNNTIDDDFYIKDELLVKDLQNIRAINWDGSVNTKIDKLKRKYFDFFNNPVVPLSTKVDVSEFTKATRTTLDEIITKANLSESNKILFEKIKPLVKDVTIEYVEEFFNSDSGAVYSDKYNTIRINKSEKSIPLEELLMHELLHAATFRKISYFETNTKGLSKKELLVLNELENIRKVLKEVSNNYWDNKPRYARSVNPLGGYRTDSIHEIISYAFTNKEFRNAIADIPYKGNISILDKLVKLIANIFGVKENTILKALLANVEILLENNEVKSTPIKTRRILEVQSDLFQKGRDKEDLINKTDKNKLIEFLKNEEKYLQQLNNELEEIKRLKEDDLIESKLSDIKQQENIVRINKQNIDNFERFKKLSDNQFLQLLNKDNNWVTFFIKSIIQDSAKKGYEKILFPSGNTASKVEGHTTLEEFKKQKEDSIKELEKDKEYRKLNTPKMLQQIIDTQEKLLKKNSTDKLIKELEENKKKLNEPVNTSDLDNEITQLKQELERVETEGFGALKPIYNFYENTVTNILNKIYGKDNVKVITDEYGNTWNEVDITPEVKNQAILLQKQGGIQESIAPKPIIKKVKEVLKKMGVDIQDLSDYVKSNPGISVPSGVNGIADLVGNVIAVAEGKENTVLTEEMVHIATAMIESVHPKMITELISKISRFEMYKKVYDEYKDIYTLPNGKPDIRKIKKEAVDRLIVEVIINNNENLNQNPELREELNQSLIRKWWNQILDWIKGEYRKANINAFEEIAERVIEGNFLVTDVEGGLYYNISEKQKEIQEKLQATKDNIEKVVEEDSKKDVLLLDSEEANNYYRIKKDDGSWEKVAKRVTDRVKAWYKQRFGTKVFTEQEKKFNELKREYGVQGHADFEEIHSRYYNSDGTKKATPSERPEKFNLPYQQMYDKLEKYYVSLINTFPKDTLIFSEMIIYDKKQKEAGALDFLAIEPSGKAHILDWKFMHISGDDVAWFKQGAFNIQIGRYKDILRDEYGVKEFGMKRAIPISMEFALKDKTAKEKEFTLKGIAIGSIDVSKIEDIKLLPVAEETESTGYEELDETIKKLNGLLKQIGKEKTTTEEDKQFKVERLNTLKKAIRLAHVTHNIVPLIDVIEVMRKEGDQILEDYNVTYKDKSATKEDVSNKNLSDFSDEMNDFIKLSDIFVDIADDLGHLIYTEEMNKEAVTDEEKADLKIRKDILDKLQDESRLIKRSQKQIEKAAMAFADKHIGQRNFVTGLLKPEKVLKGLGSLFRGVSDLSLRSLNILTKLTRDAQGRASADALLEVNSLMEIRKRLEAKGGDLRKLAQSVYQKDDDGKLTNHLIHKYNKEFSTTVNKKADEGGDMKWLKDNMNIEEYKKEANELIKEQIKRIKKTPYPGTEEEVESRRDSEIVKIKRQYDIDRADFNGWNNYVIKRHPLDEWKSEEYKNVEKDEDLLALYNFIVKFNEKAGNIGFINNNVVKTFLPFVRKGMAEQLVWDNKLSVMDNFYKSLQIQSEDVGYGSISEITGELENTIPKYYTHNFAYKGDGVNDYSDVSEDLFKNLILYIQQVEKYKYMSEIEGQLKLVKTIETFKKHLNTSRVGKVIFKDGAPEESEGNEANTKMYDDFLRVMLYDQKYILSDTDTPLHLDKVINFFKNGVNKIAGKEVWAINDEAKPTSLIKTIDATNRGFQLKTLGFEFISGAVNMFGGNIQIATQAGAYFKAREFAKNEAKLSFQKFNNEEDKEAFIQLINTFMPMKEDPSYELFKEAGMHTLTRNNLGDILFVFMRKPEQLIEKATFLTLLENSMVVDGRIVNIREFVKGKHKDRYNSSADYLKFKSLIENEIEELKKTKAIAVIRKIEDGKLVIPGLDLTNRHELQRLTTLSRTIASNATGNMSNDNINRMSMSIWTKSMMVFKNWIPKLADTRFSEFRKINDDFSVVMNEEGILEGEKYDIGRIRLLAYVLSDGIFTGVKNLNNIINLNSQGILKLDEMFEEFKNKYELETGETLNMSREDFIDLIRTNLRNQIKEIAILAGLLGVALSLGFIAPDDDEDKAAKNFHRYSQKVVDKFVSELSFFYNPAELESILNGGIFPAIGIANDFSRFTSHFFKEITGLDLDGSTSYEDVRKKAQPIKYAMKMAPVTKSLVTYLSIFNDDFAKEMKVTIQKENSR